MRYVRIHNGPDGQTHFQELDFELVPREYAPPAPAFETSEPIATAHTVLFSVPAGWYGDWHPSPRRQLYIPVSGQLQIEVSDGDVRVFVCGDIVLVEDVLEPGHTSRAVGDEPATGVFIHLDDGALQSS